MLNLDKWKPKWKKYHTMRHFVEPHALAHQVSAFIFILIIIQNKNTFLYKIYKSNHINASNKNN